MPTPYVTQAQVQADIPLPILTDALDDDRDGKADDGVLDQIIANASAAVDGKLGARYSTPFQPPIPAAVLRAAYVFTCELIYRRREITDKNPWTKEADDWRKRLDDIAARKMPLDATITEDLPAATGSMPYIQPRIGTCQTS